MQKSCELDASALSVFHYGNKGNRKAPIYCSAIGFELYAVFIFRKHVTSTEIYQLDPKLISSSITHQTNYLSVLRKMITK